MAAASKPCRRCGHRNDEHQPEFPGRCMSGYCECKWFAVDPRTGR